MRVWLALLLLVSVSGCETASLGSPCTENADCQRNATGTTNVAACYVILSSVPCPVGGGNCVCCPTSNSSAARPPNCSNPNSDAGFVDTGVVVDTGAVDTGAPETAVDSGPPPVCGAGHFADAGGGADAAFVDGGQCATGQYCTAAGQCALLGPIGQACAMDGECQTGFCTNQVCCNSRCSAAGLSCNVSSDFAGLCMAVTTPADAGTPDTGSVDATFAE